MSAVPTAVRPRVTRTELLAVVGTTLLFGLLLTTWAYVTPPLHGPDELANVDAALHLAIGQAWPAAGDLHYIQGLISQNVPALPPAAADRGSIAAIVGDGSVNELVNPMSQHPPTYFLGQAVVAHLIDFTTRRWDVVLLAMRLVDVLLVLPVPALVWASVRRATRSRRAGAAALAAVFAVPQLAQLGSSVSAWAPVITAGALATWLAVRVFTGDRSWWTVLALGGSLAVGTAVMAAGFLAVPFAIVAVLAPRAPLAPSWAGRVLRAVVVLAVPAVTTGWWYARQFVRTGTPQPQAFPTATATWPVGEPPAPTQFAGTFWNGLSESFWGRFGRYEWPLSSVVVDTATVVALAAVVWAATRRGADRRTMLVAGVFPATALLVVLGRDWATYAGHMSVAVTQGRFLFPALAALLVLQAAAWSGLLRRPSTATRAARCLLVVAALVAVGAIGLLAVASYQALQFPPSTAGLFTMAITVPYGLKPLALLVAVTGVVAVVVGATLWHAVGPTADALSDGSAPDDDRVAVAHRAAPGTVPAAHDVVPAHDHEPEPVPAHDHEPEDADRAADAVPLDSPPTDAPTQRNHP